MPCFTELRSLFYPNGVKIIPEDIYNMLTPVALAHLIMGDGSALPHGLIICTNNYSIQDVTRLMNVLIVRYRLKCSLSYKKQNNKIEYMIYISQHSMPSLFNIVYPHMCPSMLYKLGLNTKLNLNPAISHPGGGIRGESSFIIEVFKQKNWRVAARFRIHLHSIDLPLLYKIQSFFGGIGSITVNGQTASFRVSKVDDIINVIIPHFNQYPIQSAKLIDFQL
jgi:hypothetical protein